MKKVVWARATADRVRQGLYPRQVVLTTVKAVAGHFAMWAVRQSPYPCPDNLDKVLRRLQRELKKFARSQPGANGLMKLTGMFQTEPLTLEKEIVKALSSLRAYQRWNDRKNGNKDPIGFVTSFDLPKDPDDDFIDLDALVRNVVMGIAREDGMKTERAQQRGRTRRRAAAR